MKKEKFVIFILVGLLSLYSFSVPTTHASEQKISYEFLKDIQNSKSLIPVVIEFNSKCSYRNSLDRIFSLAKENSEDYNERYEQKLFNAQNAFVNIQKNIGISIVKEMNITHVMNAITAIVRGEDIEKLSESPNVKFIYDNRIEFYPTRSIASQTTQAYQLREKYDYTGEGVTVGVLDSGLDRTHQDFSNTFEDSEMEDENGYILQTRVISGEDFSEDKDGDWNDDLPIGMHGHGHGTHVAGIIGGSSFVHDEYVGMAPDVEFYIYKVFTKTKSGARNVLVAIDQAFQDGCDIINMSLGHKGGSAKGSSYFTSLTENVQEAIDSGKFFVVASAGNDGTRGPRLTYSTGSPASTYEFFSVAASNDRPFETFCASLNEEERDIDFNLSPHCKPFTNDILEIEMVPCGIGKPEEISDSVRGKIALIERGEMTFRMKMENAMKKGAVAVILYNHSAGRITPSLIVAGENVDDVATIPICMVAKTDGIWLRENCKNLPSLTMKEGRKMTIATFSSSGPTTDGYFKPEITAPGTAILSCFPLNSYQKAGGTSMSAPVVTGLAAILKEVHPDWNLMQIKSAFMNTSEVLVNQITKHPIALSMQGAGEARLEKAISTPAFLDPQALLIQSEIIQPGDLSADEPVEFTIVSNSDKSVNYDVSYEMFKIIPGESIPVTCEIIPCKFTLNPGETKTFTVQFTSEENTQRDHYDGLIWFNKSDEVDNLHVPFIIYPDSVSLIKSPVTNISIEPRNWSYSKEKEVEDLQIGFYLHSGTEQSIDGETNYNNFANIFVSLVDESGQEWALIDTPSSLLAGDYYTFTWDGKTENGKYALFDGNYYLRITLDGFVYKNSELSYEVSYDSFKEDRDLVEFEVNDSPVAQPEDLIISSKRLYKAGTDMKMDFILEDAEGVNGARFTYRYDPKLLNFLGVEAGFDIVDLKEEEIVVDYDKDHGIIVCSFVQADQSWTGKNFHTLSINFTVVGSGKPLEFDLKDGFLFRSGIETGRIKAYYPVVKGTKRSTFYLCDLNKDRKVDKYDFIEFSKCFGFIWGQEEYKEECDFNQDHCIDARDLGIFGTEYLK
ncbi:MAG: S8 family serine peptidase [Caldisericia bacterium]|nr:S8 family serine peptidase [Caldisericia bacterium]